MLACSLSQNITTAQSDMLGTLLAKFLDNCGNATYGVTISCTNVNSYCSPGGPAPAYIPSDGVACMCVFLGLDINPQH